MLSKRHKSFSSAPLPPLHAAHNTGVRRKAFLLLVPVSLSANLSLRAHDCQYMLRNRLVSEGGNTVFSKMLVENAEKFVNINCAVSDHNLFRELAINKIIF